MWMLFRLYWMPVLILDCKMPEGGFLLNTPRIVGISGSSHYSSGVTVIENSRLCRESFLIILKAQVATALALTFPACKENLLLAEAISGLH
jgi:hypothetical protein